MAKNFWEEDGWLERMDDKDILDIEFDNEEFWKMCDDLLIVGYGRKAEIWLAMLEDPDPDDLIFEYQRIIRKIAFSMGYLKGLSEREGTQT